MKNRDTTGRTGFPFMRIKNLKNEFMRIKNARTQNELGRK